jgi:hypothetical protein
LGLPPGGIEESFLLGLPQGSLLGLPPGVAASVATKMLHKKRPALIPIMDNEAILGAYMSETWPEQRASMDSVYWPSRIREALAWI